MGSVAMHYCTQCGEVIGIVRWRKGKHLCPQCTMPEAILSVATQRFFFLLPLATRVEILEPFFVDSPEWRTLFGTDQTSEEE